MNSDPNSEPEDKRCGFQFWTNRKMDLCPDCEKKGVKSPENATKPGG